LRSETFTNLVIDLKLWLTFFGIPVVPEVNNVIFQSSEALLNFSNSSLLLDKFGTLLFSIDLLNSM